MLLKGKKALVTGGTSGIGRAIALAFVENGADVIIFGTNPQGAKESIEAMERVRCESGQKIGYDLVDVSDFSLVEKAIGKVLLSFGNVDILVNGAGITKDQFLLKMSEEDWDSVLRINLKSVFNTCHALVRSMMKARSGKIINISSIIGLTGNAMQGNYAASKAGMIGLTKSLAQELGRRNICVNCIAPGYIQTRMTDVLSEELKKSMLEKIPLGRLGIPEDVAKVALFLASD
ncbi:MAG: beta-ketoacyl-ACP reductase, partial [Chlamydiota bacterium]